MFLPVWEMEALDSSELIAFDAGVQHFWIGSQPILRTLFSRKILRFPHPLIPSENSAWVVLIGIC